MILTHLERLVGGRKQCRVDRVAGECLDNLYVIHVVEHTHRHTRNEGSLDGRGLRRRAASAAAIVDLGNQAGGPRSAIASAGLQSRNVAWKCVANISGRGSILPIFV